MARYTCVPSHQQHMADTLLSDDVWLDTIFFPRNSEMLNDAYQEVVNSMTEMGVTAYKAEVVYSLHKPLIHLKLISGWIVCLAKFQHVLERKNKGGRVGTLSKAV